MCLVISTNPLSSWQHSTNLVECLRLRARFLVSSITSYWSKHPLSRPQDCIVKEHALSSTFLLLDIYRHHLPFIEKKRSISARTTAIHHVPRHSDWQAQDQR
mmetsp:Transcript_20499/g.40910  ORF Transcript_20499/g.40910 Transcript_20499/m.40910 type:complete len:102 (+) Transcript_20499:278-583(+)